MTSDARGSLRLTPQIVLGLCIVLFGAALTVDNLGLMDAGRILRFWPLAIVGLGLVKTLQGQSTSARVFGVFLVLVGLALLGDVFDVLDVWAWWPVVLIAFGLLIITRALGGSRSPRSIVEGMHSGRSGLASSADSTLSEVAFWSGVQRRVASPAFRHADLTAIMGGIELDLRQASTAGGEAVIDVFAMWGGIEIIVPPDWSVSNQITPVMGGAEDKSSGTQASANRLVLRGFAIMGGVEVKT